MSYRKIEVGRKPCIVPFCQCTVPHTPNLGTEVICAKHWRLISTKERRDYNARKRAVMAEISREPASARGELFAQVTQLDVLWDSLKKQVIEKAVGIE